MSGQLRAPGTHWIEGWVGPRTDEQNQKNKKMDSGSGRGQLAGYF
jgi:hypothetical protein